MLGHSQTKERATGNPNLSLHHRATSRLYLLSTVNEDDTRGALRRLWHSLLQGDRGTVVWWSEDCIDWGSEDLALTAKARALAPALEEMTGPVARIVLRARRLYDPIAVHYSQPSIQVDWMLESARLGPNWVRQVTAVDETRNRMAQIRNSWLKALQDLGFSPRFVSSTDIEGGALRTGGWKRLVLPHSLALSDREVDEIRAFLGREPRGVLADTGVWFDAHGRLRPTDPFDAQRPVVLPIEGYASGRLQARVAAQWSRLLERCCDVRRTVSLTSAPAARTQIHRYRLGDTTIVAFERNVEYHASDEITAAGGNAVLEHAIDLEARFAAAAHVYELRQGTYHGFTDAITFTLDPWRPSLYALLPQKVPSEGIVDFLLRQDTR